MGDASSFVPPTMNTPDPMDGGPLTSGPDVGTTVNAVLKLIYYGAVMVLGISGNSLILKVYWSKPQKTSTHVLIMGLAWVDLLTCACRIYALGFFACALLGRELPSVLLAVGVFNGVNVFASVTVTGAIALERYDCVCRAGRRLLNRRRAKLVYVGSYLFAIAVFAPNVIHLLSPRETTHQIALTCQLLVYLAVVLIVVICYGKVYQTICKHVRVNALNRSRQGPGTSRSTAVEAESRRRDAADRAVSGGSTPLAGPSSLTSGRPRPVFVVSAWQAGVPPSTGSAAPASQSRADPAAAGNPSGPTATLQRRTTRMLFVTSVVFLVTWLPYWLYIALALYGASGGEVHANVLSVMYNCTLFAYINNVVNPLIYGFANRRFRQDCFDLFGKLKPC